MQCEHPRPTPSPLSSPLGKLLSAQWSRPAPGRFSGNGTIWKATNGQPGRKHPRAEPPSFALSPSSHGAELGVPGKGARLSGRPEGVGEPEGATPGEEPTSARRLLLIFLFLPRSSAPAAPRLEGNRPPVCPSVRLFVLGAPRSGFGTGTVPRGGGGRLRSPLRRKEGEIPFVYMFYCCKH